MTEFRYDTKLDHGFLTVGHDTDDSTDFRTEDVPEEQWFTEQMLTVPGAAGCDQLVDDGDDTLWMRRDSELVTTFTKDRTLSDPSNATNPVFKTRVDSHEVQGEGSDHGLDQPVASAECTRRPRHTARWKRGVGRHTISPLKHSPQDSHMTTTHDLALWWLIAMDESSLQRVPAGHPRCTGQLRRKAVGGSQHSAP